jgi:hypothetical protein
VYRSRRFALPRRFSSAQADLTNAESAYSAIRNRLIVGDDLSVADDRVPMARYARFNRANALISRRSHASRKEQLAMTDVQTPAHDSLARHSSMKEKAYSFNRCRGVIVVHKLKFLLHKGGLIGHVSKRRKATRYAYGHSAGRGRYFLKAGEYAIASGSQYPLAA